MGSNTDDDDDLRERIERIEELVLPSRRDVLAGVAGGAATAGLLAGASGRSQAQATAGDVGEAQNPVDLYANNVYPPGGAGSGNSTNIPSAAIEDAQFTGPDGSTFNIYNHIVFHDAQNDTTEYYPVQNETAVDAGSTLSTVLNNATQRSWIYLPPRSYEGAFVYGTQALSLFSFGNQGAVLNGGTTGHALEVDYANSNPYQSSIRNVSFKTTIGQGNPYDCVHITGPGTGTASNFDLINCHFLESDRHGLYVGDGLSQMRVENCSNSTALGDFEDDLLYTESNTSFFDLTIAGHSITLTSNSNENAVWSKHTDKSNASVVDNGTDNMVRHGNLRDQVPLGFGAGTVQTFEDIFESGLGAFTWGGQFTENVSTSAVTIFSRTGISNVNGNLLVVYGSEQGADNSFTELVLFQAFGSATAVSAATRGTPASRSYSVNSSDLNLTMGSGTYNVAVSGLGTQITS